MIGPPGAGKTTLAKRIPSILPQVSFEVVVKRSGRESNPGTALRQSPLPHIMLLVG
jgi:predicted ATPase with chaperone activity